MEYPFCYLLSHGLESDGILAHLFEHGNETVAAGGGEVLAQANTVNEIEVSIYYFFCSMPAQYMDKQCYDALYQYSIRITLVDNLAVFYAGGEPYSRLATVNQVLLRAGFLGKRLQPVSVLNQQRITIHPIVKTAELFNNLVLYIVDSHTGDAGVSPAVCFVITMYVSVSARSFFVITVYAFVSPV